MMKVTLQVNGQETTLTEQELVAIVQEHLYKEVPTIKRPRIPTEEEWFEVNPRTIDRSLFFQDRRDQAQRQTQTLILEALTKVDEDPDRYGQKFMTMMPRKTWGSKTIKQLKQLALERGDHIADWVEQALEWAQRISNGESWADICNGPDEANWRRLVIWKNGYTREIGGSVLINDNDPATYVYNIYNTDEDCSYKKVVPLIVCY